MNPEIKQLMSNEELQVAINALLGSYNPCVNDHLKQLLDIQVARANRILAEFDNEKLQD